MSDLSGIYSLRGFLYQMKLYELLSFQHGWENDDEMVYEGLDDIDSGKTTLISSNRSFVQIKSGMLNKTVYYGVLSNWFLLNQRCPNSSFTLFYEDSVLFDYKTNSFFDDYYKYISSDNMKNNHPDCKHSKAYRLFSSKNDMNCVFAELNSRIQFKEIKQDDIYPLLIQEAFNKSIKNEMRAKVFVYNFIDLLHRDVEEAVSKTTSYILTKTKFFEIYNSALSSTPNKKYVFRIIKIPGFDYSQLLLAADDKFLNQIKSVSEQEQFLTQNIIDELEYEIFKASYDDDESIDKIDYLESSVHSRYMILLGNPNIHNNWDFYDNLISSSFSSDILEMDNRAKTGCCNYLTSSKANPVNAIEWDVKHE